MKYFVKAKKLSLQRYKKEKNNYCRLRKLYEYTYKLSGVELIAIYCRYWENMTIEEISHLIDLSWDATDKLLEAALLQLKKQFLEKTNPLALNQK